MRREGFLTLLLFFSLPIVFGFPSRNPENVSKWQLVDLSPLPPSKPGNGLMCAANEHFSVCSANCEHNCSTWGLPISCSRECIPGCVCDDGYVRGSRNKCILAQKCNLDENEEQIYKDLLKYEEVLNNLLDCPVKERYSLCNAHCQNSCDTLKNPASCSHECVSGCVCNAGYVRGPDKQCIPSGMCLYIENKSLEESFCPPNEKFSPCLAHCQRNCSNWSDPHMPCQKVCVPGCICEQGLVRGLHGNCIRPRQCPPRHALENISGDIVIVCPVDEHFDRCSAHCQRSCSNLNQMKNCSQTCVSGCVCDKGYIRGHSGKCVLIEKCSTQDKNPIRNRKRAKANFCSEGEQRSNYQYIGKSKVYCTSGNGATEICPPSFLNGCVCNKGFLRGTDNHCIDRRLLKNANDVHFILGSKKPIMLEKSFMPTNSEDSPEAVNYTSPIEESTLNSSSPSSYLLSTESGSSTVTVADFKLSDV